MISLFDCLIVCIYFLAQVFLWQHNYCRSAIIVVPDGIFYWSAGEEMLSVPTEIPTTNSNFNCKDPLYYLRSTSLGIVIIREYKLFLVFVSCSLLLLCPLFVNARIVTVNVGIDGLLKNNRIAQSINIACFAVYASLFADLMIDYMLLVFNRTTNGYTAIDLFIFERLFFVIFVSLPAVGAFISPAGATYIYLDKILNIASGLLIALIALRMKNPHFKRSLIYWVTFFWCVGRALNPLGYFLTITKTLATGADLLAVFIGLYMTIPLVRYLLSIKDFQAFTMNDFNGYLYVITYIFQSSLGIVQLGIFKQMDWANCSVSYFVFINIKVLVFTFQMLVVPGRVSRHFLAAKNTDLQVKCSLINLCHELKFPLNGASLGIHVLKEKISRLEVTPEIKEDFKSVFWEITDTLNTGINAVNNIYTMDKLSSNFVSLKFRKLNLVQLVKTSLKSLKLKARKKQIGINFVSPDDRQFFVNVDQSKIMQVVQNIVSNALKYTPTGGQVAVSFRVVAEESTTPPTVYERIRRRFSRRIVDISSISQYIRIEVRDSGIGISPEKLVQLFSENADPQYLVGGGKMGLGLQIAKHFVRLHNGRIGGFSPGPNEGREHVL